MKYFTNQKMYVTIQFVAEQYRGSYMYRDPIGHRIKTLNNLMRKTMDKKTAICQYLKKYHTGGERAVYSRELQRLFSIDGRGLRRKINSLRQEGYPICSDERGYYYADSQDEINGTVCRLNQMVTKVSNARTGLLYASIQDSGITVEVSVTVR